MRKKITPKNVIFSFFLIVLSFSFSKSVTAQTLNKAISMVGSSIEPLNNLNSEGAYLLKDGQLDEIYNLKFNLPISNKKITFEQTHVMVLPVMGMVHFIGTLDVDGVKNLASFQLGFLVNSDQSIAFKGTKNIQLKELSAKEQNVNIYFVLKNNKNNSTGSTIK